MLGHTLAFGSVVLLNVIGLAISNLLYDHGVPGRLSRRVAPALSGVGYLIAVLWLEVWTAVILSGLLVLGVLAVRLSFRRGLRGVTRSTSTRDWAEIAYPIAATVSLAIGWGLLGDKRLGLVPIAFVAWGDCVAGLVRGVSVWRRTDVHIWPSVAMLSVCLIAAVLVQPYWVGAFGAIVATGAERFRLVAHRVWGDNWVPDDPVIVAASLTVMGGLAKTLL